MLKRTQILLENWQVEYIKRSAKKLDFSFSETTRILLSEAILSILYSLEPKKKIGVTPGELIKMKKNVADPKSSAEEKHRVVSKLYFEARKASEHKIGKS